MKTPAFSSLLIIGVVISSLYYYDANHHSTVFTIERAMVPLEYLSNARHSIMREQNNKAIRELDEAIMSMKIIEQHTDSSAAAHIHKAINDLRMVEKEIKTDSLVERDLNMAYFNALNSVAFANLMLSEDNIEHGEKYKALRHMNATFVEMVESLKYVTDEELREKEQQIINDIRLILVALKRADDTYHFNYDSINAEFEALMEYQL